MTPAGGRPADGRTVGEVTEAMEIVATCVLLAAVEKALGDAGQIGGTA